MTWVDGKQLLTIKEFAELVGVSHATLRYYEDLGLMAPAVRADNGYRYYDPIQILSFNILKILRKLDIPIKDIQQMMPKRSPEFVLQMLEDQERLINLKLDWLREAYAILHMERNLLHDGMEARGHEDEISIRHLTREYISLGPANDFSGAKSPSEPMLKFFKSIGVDEESVFYHVGWYYEDFAGAASTPQRPTAYYTVNPKGRNVREEGDFIVGYSRGFYGDLGDIPQRIAAFAEKEGIVPTGPCYAIHLFDELSIQDPTQYLLRLTVGFTKK
ncbi:MAG: MerR family transcriptional regulator [Clostridiales Family XIII bacterium]|jgi:DNA-binding transcriptional MerR regulator|nr:MerR family transcriptional regulator [Clostridiales Family XIII bacterium]